jgi:hypothetical protein
MEDLLHRLERLERKLDAALQPRRELLSKRAAAKMLGIDRGTTLEGLIRAGHLHLVLGRIPANEIDRLLTEGVPEKKPRAKRQHAAAPAPAADIRKIDI